MPASFIGMIGVSPEGSGAVVHVIGGGISRDYLREFAQAHEASGFDRVLVGYSSASAEGFAVAGYAAAHTERLGFLVAHRPGFVAPTLLARKAATFDNLTGGRLALHIIAGASDADQRRDGDPLAKPERYRRADEYLELVRRVWTSDAPFDFKGEFYAVERAFSDVRAAQQPHPPLFAGGSSPEALEVAARHSDVYAFFGEPRATAAERMADFRARAAAHGRRPEFSMSFRPILAQTEAAAWERAEGILASIQAARRKGAAFPRRPLDASGQRLMALAEVRDVYDERLWMKVAAATGAVGNTSCLVGTAEQVADALLRYYALGVRNFLIRGFDPLADAREYGRELIPRVLAGARELDQSHARAQAAPPEASHAREVPLDPVRR